MDPRLLPVFDCLADSPYGLTEKKVASRAHLISVTDKQIVFALTRHQGILGATYTPGMPMAAFLEWTAHYVCDLTTKAIVEREPTSPPQVFVDAQDLSVVLLANLSVSFEATPTGSFEWTDFGTGLTGVIAGEDELDQVVDVLAKEEAQLESHRDGLREFGLSDDAIDTVLTECEEAIRAHLEAHVSEAFNDSSTS